MVRGFRVDVCRCLRVIPAAVLLAGTLGPLAGWAQESQPPRVGLTLEDAVHLALERNADLAGARRGVEMARARISEARSGAFPGLDFSLTYNRSWIQQSSTFTISGEDEEGQPFEQTQTVTFGQPNLSNSCCHTIVIRWYYKNLSLNFSTINKSSDSGTIFT